MTPATPVKSLLTVKRVVHLSELQAQFVADMKVKFGCDDDDQAIREIIAAMMEVMQKDPEW